MTDSRLRRNLAIPRPFAAEVSLTRKDRTIRRVVRLSDAAGGRVRVESLGTRRARSFGDSRFAVKVTRIAGESAAVGIGLDTTGIVNAFGGYYRNRLRLQVFGECSRKRSVAGECGPTDVESQWGRGDWLNAQVRLGSTPVIVAATADVSGAGANYEETPTSPATTWSHGGSSGGFSYSIPVSVPPTVGGQAPTVALSYSSQVTDARSTGSNAQSSWLGEGWDYDPGYVEYQFEPCLEGEDPTGDLCWPGIYPRDPQMPAATVTLNGVSTQLLWDGSVWRLATDDGSRVTLIQRDSDQAQTGASDGDYWRIDTVDGTSYYFGFGRAYSDSSPTQSVSWVPVFGDQRREPCKAPGEAESKCRQPSQLHLDRVVDRNGNVTEFTYTRETNKYKSFIAGRALEYVSATFPDQIRYGMNGANTTPQAMVDFGLKRRCVKAVQGSDPFSSASCEGQDVKNPADYPDVPGDLICRNDDSCQVGSPTFFELSRAEEIVTKVRSSGRLGSHGTGHPDVVSEPAQSTGHQEAPRVGAQQAANRISDQRIRRVFQRSFWVLNKREWKDVGVRRQRLRQGQGLGRQR
jgi:hypothetical protein